jgi:sulfide dehydrogenase [flavocytochrome c] flavoprotein subunit
LFERAFKQHYDGLLEYRPNAELKEVAGTLAKLEFEDVKADVLNVIPPQRGGDIARSAGLLNGEQPLGRRELADDGGQRGAGHPRAGRRHLLGAGDAQVRPHGQPACQGGRGGDHPAAQGRARQRDAGGDEHLLQLRHEATDVVHVASVHQYDAGEKTFKTVPGSGGV